MSLDYNQYKLSAEKIVDSAIKYSVGISSASPYIIAELSILKNRKTKGARAALLTGLVVSALINRGFPAVAEEILKQISDIGK